MALTPVIIKNDLTYSEVCDPRTDRHYLCATRPSSDYVLSDNWQSDPMNPSVCWRAKTQAELDAEKDQDAQRDLDDMRLIKAIALWVAGLHNITPVEARNKIKAIYKSL